jgi:uncharacterized protein (TIGR00369 family)
MQPSAEPAPERSRTFSWADPAALVAAARESTGLAFIERLCRGELPPPPIVSMLGMELVDVAPSRVVFALEPAEWMFNPIGSVHGGIAATLLDSAMGCAIQTALPAGTRYTTADLHVRYLRPMTAETGRVLATGTLIGAGRRQATAEGRVEVQVTGKLIATGTTGCIVL